MKQKNTEKTESFYIAVIIYKSSCNAPDYQPLYQECFVLLKASSLEKAKEKAVSYGKKEELSYKNEKGQTIVWSLMEVVDVNLVLDDDFDSASNGVDLYVRHFRNYEAYSSFETLLSKEEL